MTGLTRQDSVKFMTIPLEIKEAQEQERRRCVGVVLAAFGRAKLAGDDRIAAALDLLATELEHGNAGLDTAYDDK